MNIVATRLFFIFLLMVGNIFAQSWEELNGQGMQAYQAGDYGKAIMYFEKAFKQAEKEFGKNHENYATSCNNLAYCMKHKANTAKRSPCIKKPKKSIAKVLGKDHPDYAHSCNNLGLLI
ncbi:MAG: hypothetical protein KatS3mg035_1291 [Bacteroidia bacterium]|nr:MAG: hypothetical protein KatS3mg035_1291 [Bacteroidia bacterium]